MFEKGKRFNRKAFESEMALASGAMAQNDLDTATHHLERAHVIGQSYVRPHVVSHWHLLRVEWRRKNAIAVVGQLVRMGLGELGSAVGVVPVGNTGGSDISMFKRMPIDPELQRIMDTEE
jgi:uncharacterized protein DUF3703